MHVKRANQMPVKEFKGKTLISQSSDCVALHASSFRRGEFVERHEHCTAYMCLLWKGYFIERSRHCAARYGPCAVLVRTAEETHENLFESDATCFNLQVTTEFCRKFGLDPSLLERRVSVSFGPLLLAAIRMMRSTMSDCTPSELEACALDCFCAGDQTARVGDNRPSWLPRVVEELHANPTSQVALDRWAARAGVHPVYFARAFRSAVGMTFGEYQRSLRLSIAARLLGRPGLSISQIALESGFADQSHLTRLLARHTGFTPGRLRDPKVTRAQDEG